MKKGFTLIELIAVIIILAVVALIAIPVVNNVIESSKKNAAEVSAKNYASALEQRLALEELRKGNVLSGTQSISAINAAYPNLIKGEAPIKGSVTINGIKVTSYSIVTDNYLVTKENGKVQVSQYKEAACQRQTGTDGTFNYGDLFVCDLGDGVERNFYVYDNSESNSVTFLADRSFAYIDNSSGAYHTQYYESIQLYVESLKDGWSKAVSTDLPNSEHIAKNILGVSSYTVGNGIPWSNVIGSEYDDEGINTYHWLFDYTNDCDQNAYGIKCQHGGDGTNIGYQYILENVPSTDGYMTVTNWGLNIAGPSWTSVRPIVTVLKSNIDG